MAKRRIAAPARGGSSTLRAYTCGLVSSNGQVHVEDYLGKDKQTEELNNALPTSRSLESPRYSVELTAGNSERSNGPLLYPHALCCVQSVFRHGALSLAALSLGVLLDEAYGR
eukprot:985288-Prorocentrum_minimum.AAC.2